MEGLMQDWCTDEPSCSGAGGVFVHSVHTAMSTYVMLTKELCCVTAPARRSATGSC